MRAAYLTTKGGAEDLTVGEVPTPVAGKGEVLVRVRATAITPTELQWFPTFNLPGGQPRAFPVVLSHEFSGVVESIGRDVTEIEIGAPVYGFNDWFANGAQAEFCIVPAGGLARKPRSLDDAHSAVVPISALTAWQGLFDKCRLEPGERVLIHGGAGAVGTFAVQLAHWRGAHVIATASIGNLDFVRGLGADQVIDYRASRFEETARDIDVVFDGVGGDTLDRSWGVLKPGGRLVTVVSQYGAATTPRNRDAFMLVEAKGSQLIEIAALIDEGRLRAFVEATFHLADVREAYNRAQRGGMRGKIALSVA